MSQNSSQGCSQDAANLRIIEDLIQQLDLQMSRIEEMYHLNRAIFKETNQLESSFCSETNTTNTILEATHLISLLNDQVDNIAKYRDVTQALMELLRNQLMQASNCQGSRDTDLIRATDGNQSTGFSSDKDCSDGYTSDGEYSSNQYTSSPRPQQFGPIKPCQSKEQHSSVNKSNNIQGETALTRNHPSESIYQNVTSSSAYDIVIGTSCPFCKNDVSITCGPPN